MSNLLFGAIEAGGTKFICEVSDVNEKLLADTRIATTRPAETLGKVCDFFSLHAKGSSRYAGIGIASFGPLEIHKESPQYGYILQTPKAHWSNIDLVSPLAQHFACPIAVDTDVNAAARAEALKGAARGCELVVYVTVGTGIGGGVWIKGNQHNGSLHPEMGHIRIPLHPDDRNFTGVCPFHGTCLEGLASGPAIVSRYGSSLESLPSSHPAIAREGYYLGQLAATIILLYSPQRLIFGGGVMQRQELYLHIRETVTQTLAGYAGIGLTSGQLDTLIIPPALGSRAGITGALLLAQEASAQSFYRRG